MRLREWKVINNNQANNQTASQSTANTNSYKNRFKEFNEYETLWEAVNNPINQIEKYKSLVDQINTTGYGKASVRRLSDTVLIVYCLNGREDCISFRIIFNSSENNYTLQLRDAEFSGDYKNLTWSEVLEYLSREDIFL